MQQTYHTYHSTIGTSYSNYLLETYKRDKLYIINSLLINRHRQRDKDSYDLWKSVQFSPVKSRSEMNTPIPKTDTPIVISPEALINNKIRFPIPKSKSNSYSNTPKQVMSPEPLINNQNKFPIIKSKPKFSTSSTPMESFEYTRKEQEYTNII